MHRVDTPTAAGQLPAQDPAGNPGFFTKGDPLTATPATVPGQDWFNSVQEELVKVITSCGVGLDKAKTDQLWTGLLAWFAAKAGGNTFTGRQVVRKDNQNTYDTAALVSESDAGNVGLMLHAPPSTAAWINHVRAGNGIEVRDAAGALARVMAAAPVGNYDLVNLLTLENRFVDFAANRITALTLSRSVWTNLLGQEELDSANAYNPATGRFTAPAAGFYVFGASLETSPTPIETELGIEIRINGSIYSWNQARNHALANASVPVETLTRPLYLAAGSYAEAWVRYENWGGSPPATCPLNIQAYNNVFYGWRVK